FGPQALVPLGFALGVVVDDAAGQNFPVAVVSGRHLPAGEILAVEERREAGRNNAIGFLAVPTASDFNCESQGNCHQANEVIPHCSLRYLAMKLIAPSCRPGYVITKGA